MAIETITVGPDWTLLNSSDAATIQFQNRGNSPAEITRGTASTPADDAPSFNCPPDSGTDPKAIADVLLAPTGGRLWARSLNGTRFTVSWS